MDDKTADQKLVEQMNLNRRLASALGWVMLGTAFIAGRAVGRHGKKKS